MTSDIAVEDDLRRIFAAVVAPAPPPSWELSPPRRAPRLHQRRTWLARRVLVMLSAAALAGGVLLGPRMPSTTHPRPSTGLTVTALPASASLSCSLPISALSADHTTGFITLTHGVARFSPVQTSGTTYIPALGRWAAVLPQLIAPDGRSYVTAGDSPHQDVVHLVDAQGDHAIASVRPSVSVFAFTVEGVLLLDSSAGPTNGTLTFDLLDPSTGAMHALTVPPLQTGSFSGAGASSETAYVRSGNGVWNTVYDSSSNVSFVDRYDLATGTTTRWFDGRRDGSGNVQVVGADASGNPIIQLSSTDLFHTNPGQRGGIHVATLLLTAPHQAMLLNSGRVGSAGVAGNLSPLSATDGGMVWLAADDGGIWLYRPGSGLTEIATVATSTAGAPGVSISGPCR